jgi:hypothetical protein
MRELLEHLDDTELHQVRTALAALARAAGRITPPAVPAVTRKDPA